MSSYEDFFRPRRRKFKMSKLEGEVWGEEKCTFCDAPTNKDGTLSCKCPSKLVYRKEPIAPASALRLFYNQDVKYNKWIDGLRAFDSLPAEGRSYWDQQAAADRKRFEQEKREYNDSLQLDEEILTDKEAENECECGNAVNDIRVALERRRCEQLWSRYRHDHHKFDKTITTTDHAVDPGKLHRFMDFPAEIRRHVYACLFQISSKSSGLRQWQLEFESEGIDPGLRFTHLQPLDTRILVINHQIYAEALDILYSSTCFVVDIAASSILPLFIRDSTGVLAPRPTSKIKQWHIQLHFSSSKHKDVIQSQLIAVRDAMKQCTRLDKVRFTWFTVPHYWEEIQELRPEYDAMLNLFRDVRGVGEVIYTARFSKDGPCRELKWLDRCSNISLPSENTRRTVRASMESAPC